MLVDGKPRRQREPTSGLPCARDVKTSGVTVADQGHSGLGRAGSRARADDRGRCRPHRKGAEDSGGCLVGDACWRAVPHAAAGVARRRRRRSRHLQSSCRGDRGRGCKPGLVSCTGGRELARGRISRPKSCIRGLWGTRRAARVGAARGSSQGHRRRRRLPRHRQMAICQRQRQRHLDGRAFDGFRNRG